MTNDKKRDFARNKVAVYWLRWAAREAHALGAYVLEDVYMKKAQEMERADEQ